MPDLRELYQEVILDHNRRPRNYGAPAEGAGAQRTVDGRNPLCGDRITLWLELQDDQVRGARFVAEGCAISRASASMMTQAVTGKTRAEAEALFGDVHELLTGKLSHDDAKARLGSLVALAGVSRFPQRVKCASMAWHALHDALTKEPHGDE